MELQYVTNFNKGKVVLLVQGAIGYDPEDGTGVDGKSFASTIEYLQHESEVTEIEVRVNSHGGVVMDALNIFNAIRGSKKPCNTVIEGIAASSGGIIAMAGHKRYMNDFARLMIHAPTIPDSIREELDENTVKMLDQFNDMIADILTANSKHDKSKILNIINDETWLTSAQALEAGFVDEVLPTGRNFDEIFNELNFAEADLALVLNQISTQKNTIHMETVKNTLGLDKNVAENVVNSAVTKLKDNEAAAVANLTSEKEAHEATKAKLVKAQAKIEEVNNAAAVAFVENAIKDGKLNADNKDSLIEQAKNNLEGFQSFCDAIATPAARITDKLDTKTGAPKAGEVVDGKLDGKTLRDLEKSNPEKVANLMASEPEKYNALYKAQYGAEPA
jgi:ATP-dependent Clp protease, protease subunit